MSTTEEYLANNRRFAATFDKGHLPRPPSKAIAIITCMDARIAAYAMLGLGPGEANVIRNAGGVVTDDEIRSLAISQRVLGTREIMVIHHTDCGMLTFEDEAFRNAIERDVGIRPEWDAEAFTDLDANVRKSVGRIRESPFIPHRDQVRGFVYDVRTGKLREVEA